jgi:AcrR family transcriptional regulator
MGSAPFYIDSSDPPAKQEILRAAMQLFSERGLAGTSIRDIAEVSGYTNPALYRHFAGKDELALQLFEACHEEVWKSLSAALESGATFRSRLDAYVGQWLRLMDEQPQALSFLSDSARVLWPRAKPSVRRNTFISLAHRLFEQAPSHRGSRSSLPPELLAASLQGTLAELGRRIQLGAVEGPAFRWKDDLVAFVEKLIA